VEQNHPLCILILFDYNDSAYDAIAITPYTCCAPEHCTKVSYKDDPTGVKCEPKYCAHRFDTAQYVKLTVTAANGSEFVGWGELMDCVDAKLWMIGNKLCIAYFIVVSD